MSSKKVFWVSAEKIQVVETSVLADSVEEVEKALDLEDLEDWCTTDDWEYRIYEQAELTTDNAEYFVDKDGYLVDMCNYEEPETTENDIVGPGKHDIPLPF